MKYTQKQKQERGTDGEAIVTASLRKSGIWNHKLVNAGYGTVFDKIAIPKGGGYAIEVKLRKEPRIAYNKKSITPNEIKGLDSFVEKVGQDHAYIIGICDKGSNIRMWAIPWVAVRDDVKSGRRGSIKMEDFREIKPVGRSKRVFDFGFLKKRGGE